MIRTFGVQSLRGVAQPAFGDVLTAAFTPPTGNLNLESLIQVANTAIYQEGDRIILDPGQTDEDIFLVEFISGANILKCRSEGNRKVNNHSDGTTIQLSIACMDVCVQALYGSQNVIWVGGDNTITPTGGGNVVFQVTPNLPYHEREGSDHNQCRTSDVWLNGPIGTQFIASAPTL